jgi:hypothetical protein
MNHNAFILFYDTPRFTQTLNDSEPCVLIELFVHQAVLLMSLLIGVTVRILGRINGDK